MDRYCVVISGLRAGVTNPDAWAPVAAALKLDEAAFAQRVLAALPLIVHQHLEQAAADHLTAQLQAMQIDARTWPDDEQLVYVQRDGTSRGPLPLSALDTFIEPGEAYRLRGHAEWRQWVAPAPPADVESAWEPAASEQPAPLPSSDDAEFMAPAHDVDDARPLASEPAPAGSDLLADDTSTERLPTDGMPPLPPGEYAEPAAPADDAGDTSLIDPESAADEATLPGDEADAVPPTGRSKLKVALVCLLLLAILTWFFTGYQSQEPSPPPPTVAPAPAATVSAVAPPSTAPAPATSAADHPAADAKNTTVAPAAASTAELAANAAPSMTDHCADHAPGPKTPEEVSLLANGRRHLTGRALRTGTHGEIYVVEAALGYEGMCRPNPYQIYVFRGGQLTGTLAVDPMQPRSDGAITDFKALDPDHLQIEIAHYQPTDPLCCASSHETRVIALSRFGADFPGAAASTPAVKQHKK